MYPPQLPYLDTHTHTLNHTLFYFLIFTHTPPYSIGYRPFLASIDSQVLGLKKCIANLDIKSTTSTTGGATSSVIAGGHRQQKKSTSSSSMVGGTTTTTGSATSGDIGILADVSGSDYTSDNDGPSTSLSTYLLIHLSTYPLIHLYTYPLIYLSTYLLIHLSTYLLIYLSTYLLIHLYTYLLICLYMYKCTYPLIYLSTYTLIHYVHACTHSESKHNKNL